MATRGGNEGSTRNHLAGSAGNHQFQRPNRDTDVKVFATGLAAGILLDATVIRALLVPAVVSLLGRWNWWLPAWPARLLRVKPSVPGRPAPEGAGR